VDKAEALQAVRLVELDIFTQIDAEMFELAILVRCFVG
jgi:hypothetical protein